MTQEWPKKATMYLHGDTERAWKIGEKLGLSEGVIKERFKFCLYELTVEIEVNEDGTYKILNVKE